MFDSLSQRLTNTIRKITGQGRLTESNIKDNLREVRIALIEADVALPVIQSFTNHIKEKALGTEVLQHLNPGQAFVKLIQTELEHMMGDACEELNLTAQPPVVILMAGLQGSGKTTTTAKLARLLKETHEKTVMVCSTDVYRPAAIDQLETLAKEVDVLFFPSNPKQKPLKIAKEAVAAAKKQFADVIIIDTAGRLHVDKEMMDEIKAIHKATSPTETLFIVDSMTGQDAANTAKAFNDTLSLTGVILTKADGDARGGAALSIRQITGTPIKFIGVGEKVDALEPFHPDRIASRILGMGDMLSLIENVEQKADKDKAKKLAKKLQKGKGFDLEDYREQLQQLGKMGGISGLISKIPGMGNLPGKDQINDDMFTPVIAIINSMTAKERRFPHVIKGSRKRRISKGSGTSIPEINRMLKQFAQMQKMMKKVGKKGGMQGMMRSMQGMMPPGGGMPPLG